MNIRINGWGDEDLTLVSRMMPKLLAHHTEHYIGVGPFRHLTVAWRPDGDQRGSLCFAINGRTQHPCPIEYTREEAAAKINEYLGVTLQ